MDAITKAWLDKGINPIYHEAKQEQLRKEWPALYYAIIEHIEQGK